jgi:hypothetical protein
MPEKLTNLVQLLSDPDVMLVFYGRLGLALDNATTVPIATAAPTIRAILIANVRERFCLAGAMAAPAGLDAATPDAGCDGAAAVPNDCGGAFCWGGVCGLFSCEAVGAVWGAMGTGLSGSDAICGASAAGFADAGFWMGADVGCGVAGTS